METFASIVFVLHDIIMCKISVLLKSYDYIHTKLCQVFIAFAALLFM